MEEIIQAEFGIVSFGFPTIQTFPPYERVGFYFMTSSSGQEWAFTGLLPALEDLAAGRRTSVSASSELVYLEATQTEVVLTEEDIGPLPPCVVPLAAFIDLIWRWWNFVETNREECVRRREEQRRIHSSKHKKT